MVILDASMLPIATQDRFWSRVDRRGGANECWPWTGFLNPDGYGSFSAKRWIGPATHVMLTLDARPRPNEDARACHSCDNPTCVNPAHLWWGTQKENIQDASKKGRMRGSPSKLHADDFKDIAISNLPLDQLARRYRVTLATIKKIKRGYIPKFTAKIPTDSRRQSLQRYRTL